MNKEELISELSLKLENGEISKKEIANIINSEEGSKKEDQVMSTLNP
jgi:nucleoid DNA-binding protein